MPSTCLVLCYPLVLRLLVTGGLGQSVRLEEPEVALCLSIWEAFHVQFTCSGHGKCQTSDWKTLLSPKLAIQQMVFFFFLLPIIPKSVFFCINLSAAILIGNKIKYHWNQSIWICWESWLKKKKEDRGRRCRVKWLVWGWGVVCGAGIHGGPVLHSLQGAL